MVLLQFRSFSAQLAGTAAVGGATTSVIFNIVLVTMFVTLTQPPHYQPQKASALVSKPPIDIRTRHPGKHLLVNKLHQHNMIPDHNTTPHGLTQTPKTTLPHSHTPSMPPCSNRYDYQPPHPKVNRIYRQQLLFSRTTLKIPSTNNHKIDRLVLMNHYPTVMYQRTQYGLGVGISVGPASSRGVPPGCRGPRLAPNPQFSPLVLSSGYDKDVI